MLRKMVLWVVLCCSCISAFTQSKNLVAVKASQVPVIDGILNESVWRDAPVANNFVQYSPNFGHKPSVATEVHVLYDNSAIYIGAFLKDDPKEIRQQITSRDGESRQNVDYFSIFFDTYNDQQNGFQFLVTPSNVQTDAKLSASPNVTFNEFGDRTWDAVWQSKTSIKENGWVVEMRIPYISLRFAKKDLQTWGIQFMRFTRRNNEVSYWNKVDPNISGFVNQFGYYSEIKNIEPPLRLSFSPYLTTGVRINPVGMGKRSEWLRNGGMDVKYGINESFTLDATLIPDFGQVVSDNVTNNLTPYEIKFNENRPFFTEGIELFNKAGLFYSRRIGTIPSQYDSINNFVGNNPKYEIIKNPALVQLYNAIKLSGRTKNKLGIGIFNAVTAPSISRLRNISLQRDSLITTEPLSNFNLIVLDQALRGRSSITFTNTNVIRNGKDRDANVSAFDWSLFNRSSNFQFSGTARYSKIFGYTPYYGSIHLVDDTVRLNGKVMIKPYGGYNTKLSFAKVGGTVQGSISGSIISNTYDPNDLAILQTPNIVNYYAGISYNQLTATENFITYRFSLNAKYNLLYKPYKYNQIEYWATTFLIFRNFWDVSINVGFQPKGAHDYFELRTAKKFLARPSFYYISAQGSSDSRKRLFFSYAFGYNKSDVQDGNYYYTGGGLRYRFSNRFTLSVDLARQDDQNQIGYAFRREANGDPIVGYRKNVEISSVLSGIYNFTPRLNLTIRSRHYWNQVHYKNFFNADANGKLIPRNFIPGQDENFNLFNTDAFLTWDFGLGSRMIVGWKNWLGDPYGISSVKNYLENLNETFNASHGNQVTVKLIYFLDYNQLKGNRINK